MTRVTYIAKITARQGISRVSLRLVDPDGSDRGQLGETRVLLPKGGH